jgi:hypothetical protein
MNNLKKTNRFDENESQSDEDSNQDHQDYHVTTSFNESGYNNVDYLSDFEDNDEDNFYQDNRVKQDE